MHAIVRAVLFAVDHWRATADPHCPRPRHRIHIRCRTERPIMDCCDHCQTSDPERGNPSYRRALWIVLGDQCRHVPGGDRGRVSCRIGIAASRRPRLLGDAANYGISLLVVGMALRYRAMAAFAKGVSMGAFGLWVIATVVWHAVQGTLPSAVMMGAVGFAALTANAISFGILWFYRTGDANMRSAWICTRNDVLGNLAVLLAALACSARARVGRILLVAATMAALALQGASTVLRQSLGEMRQAAPVW